MREIKKIFYEFDFDEDNFYIESGRLRALVSFCIRNKIRYHFLADLPPCIPVRPLFNKRNPDIFLFGRKDINISLSINVLNNVKIISKNNVAHRCMECEYWNNRACSGYFNRKFKEESKEVIKKIGKKRYLALKYDYKNGFVVNTSQCNAHCSFCFSRNIPDRLLKTIPHLKLPEINHFFEYLPSVINGNAHGGGPSHCRSGEFLCHPDAEKTIILMSRVFKNKVRIFTNGLRFVNLPDKISKKIKWDISLGFVPDISTADERRVTFKKGHRDIIKKIKKEGLEYLVHFIPLKRYKSQLVRYIKLFTDLSLRKIQINIPGYTKFNASLSGELDWQPQEYFSFIKEIHNKSNKKIEISDLSQSPWNSFDELIAAVKSSVKNAYALTGGKKSLLITGERAYALMRNGILSNNLSNSIDVLRVRSSFGGSSSTTGHILLNDILSKMKNLELKKYSFIILPYNMFDPFFYDISLNNINKFYAAVKTPVIILK